ncbi:unnamed protein product [Symbiodinium sp. CCMP2592]|nr:unnamed protein product [Symbiodinium sp. CCMP2592]
MLEAHVKLPAIDDDQEVYLLLLDDEAESYPGPSGDWNFLTCAERRKRAKNSWLIAGGHLRIRTLVREKIRPRWWFVALADCSGQGFRNVQYEVHAQNILYGWASEFSTDRRYALHAFVAFSVIFAAFMMVQTRANVILASRQHEDSARSKAAHPFARILLSGICVELVACLFEIFHLMLFASNGRGSPMLHAFSLLATTSSNFILVSLLLLVSQGKCVTYKMIPKDAWRIFTILGPFLLSCLLLELWGDFATSRTYSSDYVYTTPCGCAVIAVDLALLAFYGFNVRTTLSQESGRADSYFYRRWGVAFGCWFGALPFSAALSKILLAPTTNGWKTFCPRPYQAKIVSLGYVWYIVSLSITKGSNALVYGALVVALWPENRRTHFKMISASPEELLENCPSPGGSAREHEVSEFLPGAKLWLNARDLPNLLCQKFVQDDTFHLSKSQSRVRAAPQPSPSLKTKAMPKRSEKEIQEQARQMAQDTLKSLPEEVQEKQLPALIEKLVNKLRKAEQEKMDEVVAVPAPPPVAEVKEPEPPPPTPAMKAIPLVPGVLGQGLVPAKASMVTSAIESLQAQAAKPGAGTAHLAEEKAAKMLGSKDIPAGMCSDELEINDYPQIARQKITHRDPLVAIEEMTGAKLQVKGQHFASAARMPEGAKKLYVEIIGPTQVSVAKAKHEVYKMMEALAIRTLNIPGLTRAVTGTPGRYDPVVGKHFRRPQRREDEQPSTPKLLRLTSAFRSHGSRAEKRRRGGRSWLACWPCLDSMTRGNQRDRDRERAANRNAGAKTNSTIKSKEDTAAIMREKQRLAEEKKASDSAGGGGGKSKSAEKPRAASAQSEKTSQLTIQNLPFKTSGGGSALGFGPKHCVFQGFSKDDKRLANMFMPERFKEYHRTLRQKRSEELSMKQVAGSFGGLYAVIHLLQYFDIWTLLLLMVGAYFIYRQIVDNWSKVWLAFNQDQNCTIRGHDHARVISRR